MPKKLTTECWVSAVRAIHGDKYDYSKSVYTRMTDLIVITCPIHGDYKQRARDHARGSGCHKCGLLSAAKSRQVGRDAFIAKARTVHGKTYSYEKVIYKTNRHKVVITCPEHGDFRQTPSNHLNGFGCTPCGRSRTAAIQRSNTTEFISKAKILHGNRYDYSDSVYLGAKTGITILCVKHGYFTQEATHHLSGAGCYRCSLIVISNDEFVSRSRAVHKNRYSYENSIYTGSANKVAVNCSVHGLFYQSAGVHLAGHGCPACANEVSALPRSGFTALSDHATLYIIRCFNSKESFYKIGITTKSVDIRFKYCLPYSYEIIMELSGDSGKVYDAEKSTLHKVKQHKYRPSIVFGGASECFSVSKGTLINIIKNIEAENKCLST